MKKFAIIGQQCSGKTSAANFIKAEFERPYVLKFADPIYDTLTALRQPKHRAFMQEFGDLAKKHFGDLVFTELYVKTVNAIENNDAFDVLLCDDIRRQHELDACRNLGFKIISIDAPARVRKKRAENLGLGFLDKHNSETEVPSLIGQADFIIVDHGISIEQLKAQCQRTLAVLS